MLRLSNEIGAEDFKENTHTSSRIGIDNDLLMLFQNEIPLLKYSSLPISQQNLRVKNENIVLGLSKRNKE